MNKVFLIGRLTKDPELRYTQSNIAVVSFTLAVNRNHTNQSGERETDFIPVVVWNKQAENINKYVSKGNQIAVLGRIQTRTYEDNKGNKKYATEVIGEEVQFLERKEEKQSSSETGTQSATNTQNIGNNTQRPQDPFENMGNQVRMEDLPISDDDLPF